VAIPLTVNGSTFQYPQQGDKGYAGQATSWAQALTNGCLQLGGSYTLLSDINLSAFGILAPYFTSKTANPAATGFLRLARTDALKFRNNANSADLAGLGLNAQDNLTANGAQLDGQCMAQYQSNAGFSVPTGVFTIVNFASIVRDTDSAVTTGANWKFIVPAGKGGDYLITSNVRFSGLTANTGILQLAIFTGGFVAVAGASTDTANGATNGVSVAGVVNVAAGQTIDVRAFQSQGSNRSLTTTFSDNNISIKRLV
jgi:hypothetical protein